MTGAMNTPRGSHTATLLSNGRVLVVGGDPGNTNGAELYDPANETWTTTGALTIGRDAHTATLLANGKVLVTGGLHNNGSFPLSSAELYNPATGTWTAISSMDTGRYLHTATLLPNGKVLVAGGYDGDQDLSSVELYDPAAGTWAVSGPMTNPREAHTATLLPNGKLLVAGGQDCCIEVPDYHSDWLSSAELYDPANGTWTATDALDTKRVSHTATLLPNGKLLVAGGAGGLSASTLSSAELYDVGLGFNASWQPQIATVTSPLNLGSPLALTGSRFRGISEGSGGNTQDSPADYPVVQLRSVESGQTLFLLTTNWSTNSFTSAPVNGLPPGWTLATMFVNGIPSTSSILLINAAPTPTVIILTNPTKLPNGAFQFAFTNTPGVGFSALATTNVGLPLSNWTVLGPVMEVSPGQFQFTDPQAANIGKRFYSVRSP